MLTGKEAFLKFCAIYAGLIPLVLLASALILVGLACWQRYAGWRKEKNK